MASFTAKPSKTSKSNPYKTLTTTNSAATTTSSSAEEHQSHKWEDLPSDIILDLIKYLDLKSDIPRLRGVCTSWRSALPLSVIPEDPTYFDIPGINDSSPPLLLFQTNFYFLSPLNPSLGGQWVARMAQIGPNKFHLFNPFQLHEYLDYFISFPPVTGEINLLNCRVQELCTSWCIFQAHGSDQLKPASKKVVGGWNFKSDYLFAVLAQLEPPGRGDGGGLVLWRLGDKNQTRFEETFEHTWRILDIAYHNGRFYALDAAAWRMGVVDVDYYNSDQTPKMKFFNVPDIKGENIRDCYSLIIDGRIFLLGTVFLVPSNGRLFMVIVANPVEELDSDEEEEVSKIVKVDVTNKRSIMFFYVLNEGREMEYNAWERVPDIGDNIFFIGYDSSFSLPSALKNLPRWKPGSICMFTWPFPVIFDYGEPKVLKNVTFAKYWRYLKIYQHNTEEEDEKGIVPFEKLGKHKYTYTGLFFPPPPWVIWRCPSRSNAIAILHNLKFSKK